MTTPETRMRLPLTRRLALPGWARRLALMGLCIGVCICAGTTASASDVKAEPLVENVPIVGGTAALSNALGIDPVPERARFVPELVRIIYDVGESKSGSHDALRMQLAAHLKDSASVRIDGPIETVPIPLSARIWGAAVFQRLIDPDNLFAAVMQDRSAALLCRGLAAVDDETLRYLAEQPALLRRLYEQSAGVFAAFGGSLRIRHEAVLVPGGTSAVPLWEAVLGEPVSSPDRFIRELFSRREGRVAYLYDSLSQLDASRRAFALGLWMARPEQRLTRFKSLLNTITEFPGWGVPDRPFSRPPDDAILMLTRIDADDRGSPRAPAWRTFWSQAFGGVDIPREPARRLRHLEKGGIIDAAWMAESILNAPTRLRAERLDQIAFGQRAFAGLPDSALPDALVAVRGFPRYRMLVLTLERLGIRSSAAYAASLRHAEQLSALDPARASIALNQYQGALALLVRLGRVHRLDTTQAETLVNSLARVPLTADGYAGGIARWLRSDLLPILAADGADVDARILRSVAGRPQAGDAAPVLVSWEERDYRVDLIQPESRRIARMLQKFRAESTGRALDIETIASALLRPDLSVSEIQATATALTSVRAPASAATADKIARASRELSTIGRSAEIQKAADVAKSLMGVVDEMLANALRSWAYAMDLGDASGARVISADVSARHDFGSAGQDTDRRIRQPWAEPEPVVQASVPWHLAGSLLGLDLGLSQTRLRRLSADVLPQPPRLLTADRDVFARTVSLLNPTELADRDVDTMADAIAAGRERVARLDETAGTLDEVADEISMDGWRRRALRWTITNDPSKASSYFSLAELMYLGRTHSSGSPGAWSPAAVALDGCLCRTLPAPGRWAVMVGRSRGGQISGQVADLNLRILLALKERGLPAALARDVLAGATQEYIDTVQPLYPDDWLTLVRSAQAVSSDRIADYVAALTADGTLSPIAQPRRTP